MLPYETHNVKNHLAMKRPERLNCVLTPLPLGHYHPLPKVNQCADPNIRTSPTAPPRR